MKLTTYILAVAMMTGAAWGQNRDAVDNTPSKAQSREQKQTNDGRVLLAMAANGPAIPQGKPAAGSAARGPVPFNAARPIAVPARRSNPVAVAVKPRRAFVARRAAVMVHRGAIARTVAAMPTVRRAAPVTTTIAAGEALAGTGVSGEASDRPKPEEKKWAMNGKRDPFFSPVVQESSGSGCSSGKKCLDIGQINLRGVVQADNGFIAVVTNALNKAYFLHENDPVFNGYVVKITGDSVVFQETVQDKL
ncbi:MAG: hypothetical protein WA623_10200, partial [Candidatus Sulfotelmatobacter sp.]